MYLSFSKSSFPGFLSFTGERRFFRIWREGTCYLLSKDSFRYSPEFRRKFRRVSLRRLLSKNSILFTGQVPGSLATVATYLVTPTAVQELRNLIPISSDEKATTSGAEASANHLDPSSSSSTSSSHATQWPTFLLRPPGYGVQVVCPSF